MKTRYRFEALLGTLLVALWLALFLWQNPGLLGGRIKSEEAQRYLAALQRLPMPEEDRAPTLKAMAAWMAGDDGRPVYMLNLMRLYPQLKPYDGALPFAGTPLQSNAHYEDSAIPMLLKRGGYPTYAGVAQGANLLEHRAELDDWSRVLLVRYPSRRAFMEVVTDPAYAQVLPYKLMALSVVLTPSSPEILLPELPWLAGAVGLFVFLAAGWLRAARGAKGAQ